MLESTIVEICKTFRFESAHVLPHHPGKCSRLHGHSYRLEVYVTGAIREDGPARGMIEDFGTISDIIEAQIIEQFDHASLNDFMENPTAENIVMWIGERLMPHLAGLTRLVLWETPTACAIATREDFG